MSQEQHNNSYTIIVSDRDLDRLNDILLEKRDRYYEQGNHLKALEVEGIRVSLMGQQAQQIGQERRNENNSSQ